MPEDRSKLETVTLHETSGLPLNETTLPSQSNLVGQIVDDRFVIEKELGRGGVGAVYLAHDRTLHDKRVVIKVLLDRSLENSWVVQKFQQEKEALARIDHPGVVGVLDGGKTPDGKQFLSEATLKMRSLLTSRIWLLAGRRWLRPSGPRAKRNCWID